jgi:SAM-dependent methyltransferase
MSTSSVSAGDVYASFAPFYDAFTAASDYELWTEHVLALAGRYGWRGGAVLDVACGTGNSSLPFSRRGLRVTGSDISAAMLAEAARKAPDIPLIEADMRALPRIGAFELVVCFDDSLNHLLDESEVEAALASMAANLAAGGLLLFDVNSLLTYRTTFASDTVSGDDDLLFLWRGDSTSTASAGCLATAQIEVFRRRADQLYERTSSVHRQRHYPPARVTSLLRSAGLECLGVHGVRDDGSHVAEVDETQQLKAMYVARLAKGGELK